MPVSLPTQEDEERFIIQTQMQRKANFHAVQEPSVDWNMPQENEFPQQILKSHRGEERNVQLRTSDPVCAKNFPYFQHKLEPVMEELPP